GINDIHLDTPFSRNDEAMQNQFVAISQTIPLSNRVKLASDIGKESSKLIEQKKDILKVDIAFAIRQAFIEAYYAHNSLSILDEYISFLQQPLTLITNLSSVEKNSVERYIKTQLLQESYKLKRENQLQQISIAKEQIELVGNIKIDSFDTIVNLRNYTNHSIDELLNIIDTQNPRLKILEQSKTIAKRKVSLAKAKEIADITVTTGVYQRFDRDDYVSVSVAYPLFVHNRQSNKKIQALKRVNIQNITYNQTQIKLQQSLKIALHKLKAIEQELNILNKSKIKIRKLIANAKSELSISGSLLHYYELFTQKTDNLLAINQKNRQKDNIQNSIMQILGEIE
ncbi:MAG TPA: TolC family protein, partial [Campylobacterales bacterium]|nr:TolC family protein [Campylobacterales bacterium]